MTNFIPIFPLEIVVFPGEKLNLHIFEPRYKQLIADCNEMKKPFGIVVVLGGKLMDFGTLIYIDEIVKTYENAEMDITTRGDRVFRILEIIQDVPDKLYAGAIVNYPENNLQGSELAMQKLLIRIKEFHEGLQVKKEFSKPEEAFSAYDIAHFSGLSLEQEYEFLQLFNERQRQEYLKRHFDQIVPAVKQMQEIKDKIQLNGHFRNLKSP